ARLQAIVSELHKTGHQVEVVTALPNHPTGEIFPKFRGRFYLKEDQKGIIIHRVWLYAALGSGVRRMINYISFTVNCFYGLLRCKKPDYIFIESPPLFLSIPGFVMSMIWKRPFIFNVADLWPDSAKQLKLLSNGFVFHLLSWLEKWTYKKALYINAVTDGIKNILIDGKGIPENKVLFLPNGVDTELFNIRSKNDVIAERFGIKNKNVVLYAGTHGYAHGIEVALEAASILMDRQDIVFVFIGDGSEKKKLIKIAKEIRLSNVRFLDPAPPNIIADLYSIACIGLSTLRDSQLFEGTRPVKIFSSMASGVPVLYSGNGEGAKLVEQYSAGLVVPPEDSQELALAVVKLVDDKDFNRTLGQNGRQFVENELSWDLVIKTWISQLTKNTKR
ncbi:MAG TPA: glycosyltransferase family 4 protein, partial [Chitinophagaceae bacterium]|nr:glycosyltransferase family 4 protein [Chitinophagaceae bacterium]